jgi:hypothetical protein
MISHDAAAGRHRGVVVASFPRGGATRRRSRSGARRRTILYADLLSRGNAPPVDTKKIRFVRTKPWLDEHSPSKPGPILKTLPPWYRNAEWFVPDAATGKPAESPDGSGKMPTWKACPAVLDVMGAGYTYKTPCDIEFTVDSAGDIHGRVLDDRYRNFLQEREPMAQFWHPHGYHQKHFAWWADWAVELPEGYSALYTHPMNRHELPFMTTSGIVDNDKVHLPGTMPFFFVRGLFGVLPAGTPYAQIIPFKREHWESEVDVSISEDEMRAKAKENLAKYRRPDGGVYQREVWERRKYS